MSNAAALSLLILMVALSAIFSGLETGIYRMSRLRLRLGAEKGRWLSELIPKTWEEVGRPCSERAIDHALSCARRRIAAHDDLPRPTVKSRIVEEACIGCGLCYVACRDGGHMAIEWNEDRLPRVDRDKCVGCGLCLTVRPVRECILLEPADASGSEDPPPGGGGISVGPF